LPPPELPQATRVEEQPRTYQPAILSPHEIFARSRSREPHLSLGGRDQTGDWREARPQSRGRVSHDPRRVLRHFGSESPQRRANQPGRDTRFVWATWSHHTKVSSFQAIVRSRAERRTRPARRDGRRV